MHAPPSCRAELSHSPCARAAIRAVPSVLQSRGYIRTPLHCKLSTLHRPLVRRCAPVTSPVLILLRPPQRLLLTASPPFLVGTGAPQRPGAASRPSQHPSPTPARHCTTGELSRRHHHLYSLQTGAPSLVTPVRRGPGAAAVKTSAWVGRRQAAPQCMHSMRSGQWVARRACSARARAQSRGPA
jgi:hypothetical protein